MRIVFSVALALLTIILHLSFFPFADLPITVLIAVLFFSGYTPALILATFFGFILDLFSPVFGVHLLLYPLLVTCARRIYSALLTDQSLLSFAVLTLGSFFAFRILDGIFFAALSLNHSLPSSLPFLYALRSHGVALLFQAVSTVLFYFLGSAVAQRLQTRYHQ